MPGTGDMPLKSYGTMHLVFNIAEVAWASVVARCGRPVDAAVPAIKDGVCAHVRRGGALPAARCPPQRDVGAAGHEAGP